MSVKSPVVVVGVLTAEGMCVGTRTPKESKGKEEVSD